MDPRLLQLINKDMGIDLPHDLTRKELNTHLEEYINELINNNFSLLIQALYRIDVSEPKLKAILLENPDQDAAKIIAQMIIERMAEKLRSGKERGNKDDDIPEEDKW